MKVKGLSCRSHKIRSPVQNRRKLAVENDYETYVLNAETELGNVAYVESQKLKC